MAELEYTIPEAVLGLLRHQWLEPDRDSAFEFVFRRDPGRQRRPSYYFIRKGSAADPDGPGFSYEEALALISEGAFGRVAQDRDTDVCINEHAAHALNDFCRDVYGAWATYRKRLADAERACPYPGANGS